MGMEIESHIQQELTQLTEILKIELEHLEFNFDQLLESLESAIDTYCEIAEILGENAPPVPDAIERLKVLAPESESAH